MLRVAWTQVRMASAKHRTRQHKLTPPRNPRLIVTHIFLGQYFGGLPVKGKKCGGLELWGKEPR